MTAPTPAISTFTDGVVAHAADLNSIGSNLTNLYNYTMGGFRTYKPQCEVRVTSTTVSIPNAAETLVAFNTADVNTDAMWVGTSASQFSINTAGTYFLYFQAVHQAGFSNFSVRLLVNGTSASTNAVGSTSGQANGGNVSAIVPLTVGATVYGDIYQSTGAAVNLATTYGGCRMAAYWISP